jgi:heat-inducible transcriptional repressor
MTLSPASVRNVMSDLEGLGLIYAPHTSAGRLPTQTGLRLFIDGLLEVGDISGEERSQIESRIAGSGRRRAVEELLGEAGEMLSGLSRCAGIVLVDKQSKTLKHVEFVNLGQGRALAVLVGDDGDVENRIITLPEGLPLSSLHEASNYINARIGGRTLAEARARIEKEIEERRAQLDQLTASVVTEGLATWSGDGDERKSLIVCGRSHLLEDVRAMEDLERVRLLFEDLDTKTGLIQLLGLAEGAEGVRIFIGSENKLFSLSGSALIVSPFEDTEQKIVGVLGVIGPTRLNYARIIPMVDYTAKLLGRLVP